MLEYRVAAELHCSLPWLEHGPSQAQDSDYGGPRMHRRLVFALYRRRWLILAFLIAAGLLLLRPPAGLAVNGWRVLVLTILAIMLWVSEAVPAAAVAFVIAGGQVLLLHKEAGQVASSFMSDSVFFIMGSLMLGVAMVKQRLDRRLAFVLTRLTGPGTLRIAFGVLATCAIIASFIADHTVAAFMLPVALTLASADGEDQAGRRRLAQLLLLCVAYGCNIGALGTPSGGARNIIMMEYWESLFRTSVGYADWIKFAFPVVLLQIPGAFAVLWLATRPHPRQLSAAAAALRQQAAQEGPMGVREWGALAIFLATIVAWATIGEEKGLGMIAVLSATCYLIVGLVDWSDYNSGVNWGVVLVYAAAISLGQAMKETGAAEWLATSMLGGLETIGLRGELAIFAVLALVTLLFTNIMSAAATVAVLGPILLQMANDASLDPVRAGFVVALTAAFGYVTTFSHPPNMIVYGSGRLRSRDYLRAGWRVTLVSMAALFVAAVLYWPHLATPGPIQP